MKVSIYTNSNPENESIKKELSLLLKQNGHSLDDLKPHVVIFIGGDGTFLRAVHQYIDILDSVCFLGLNSGSLGFFLDIEKNDFSKVLSLLNNKDAFVKEHHLIECLINNENTIYAVNEVRLENPFHTLICDVDINHERLETFRGNGLVISSELGSSAYNKSLGGALIDHDLNALELSEIAPIENNVYRSLGSSLVVSSKSTIELSGNIEECLIGYDHFVKKDVKPKTLMIKKSTKTVKILYPKSHSFVSSIKRSFIK